MATRVITRYLNCNSSFERYLNRAVAEKRRILSQLQGDGAAVDWNQVRLVENELDELLQFEEMYWQQRSRVSWLKEGDLNTKFFHAKASARKTRNRLSGLFNSNGVWVTGEENMVGVIQNYFDNLFASSSPSNAQVGRVINTVKSSLCSTSKRLLDSVFTAEEVRVALFQMNPWKAPGEDGFPAGFFQKFWTVVGDDLTRVCLDCLNNGHSVGKINRTVICLIPKVKKVENLTDIRPISLCNVVYKCVSKVLANRLRKVLRKCDL